MQKLTAEITMSIDGFITDPAASVGTPLEGHDPGRLHDWMFDAQTEADAAIREEMYGPTGAVLMGKRMFDVGFEPWGDPPPFKMPVFIVTHEERVPLAMKGGTTYTFVAGGIKTALDEASAAAGAKNVGLWGGADVIRQYLEVRLLDEMHIHIAPMLLGGGVRLFEGLDPEGIELRKTSCIDTPGATHLRFDVVK